MHIYLLLESWSNSRLPIPEPLELAKGMQATGVHHASKVQTGIYAERAWDPYYQQDIKKLERVQRQAARFITKDYRTREPGCVNRMLQDLNLPPLAELHRQARLGLIHVIQDNWRSHPSHPPKAT